MMKRLRFLALVVAALAVDAPGASADVLCVKRSGEVVARAACRRKDRPFDPAALGLVGVPGPTGAPGEPGTPGAAGGHPYRVVDATGKTFGTTIAFDTARAQVAVTVPDDDQPVQFVVEYGGFSSELALAIHYQEPDCAGTPFVFGGANLVPYVHVVGTVGYYSRTGDTTLQMASYELADDECPTDSVATGRGTCCRNSVTTRIASPARAVPIAVLGVTPPFTIEP